jgi:hypothetical protein
MRRYRFIPLIVALAVAALACRAPGGASPTSTPPPPRPTQPPATATEAAVVTITPTAAEAATPSADTPAPATPEPITPEPATAEPAGPTFIAYVRDGQLLVSDVTGGVLGGTTQYTLEGVDDEVVELAWSPSGEFIAHISLAGGGQRLFYTYAVGAGSPVELGPGGLPAWSPDNTRLAYLREDNLWLTSIDDPAPRQMTAQAGWVWGRPAFAPDGGSLVVAGAPRENLGAQGNTDFMLYQVALDGSGVLTPLPGMAAPVIGRLPFDLAFSRDGQWLAFSTSFHISACASEGSYLVAAADGSRMQAIISPSLARLLEAEGEIHHFGYSFAWMPDSQSLVVNGLVRDCSPLPNDPPTEPGPQQISVVDLVGGERLIAVGEYDTLSVDRSGRLIATLLRTDDFAVSYIHLLDPGGNLVLDLGQGDLPQLQP